MEQTSESAAGETQRAVLPTPFLTKTYQLVDDPSVDDLISWNEDGSGFIIWRPVEFARDLLPKYFKHNNLSSFVRQLNTYGFRKVVPDRWEFANDCFKKGEKGLLRDIQRRKLTRFVEASSVVTTTKTALMVAAIAPPPATVQLMNISTSNPGEDQVFSSTSSPGGTVLQQVTNLNANTPTPLLVEENERLRKVNEQMTNELSHLRGLCNNIFQLLSSYGRSSAQQDPGNPSVASKRLDLFQSGMLFVEQGGSSSGRGCEGEMDDTEYPECRTSPKLFGVSIGAKRVRRSRNNASGTENKSSKAQSEMNVEQSHSGPY